MHKNGKVKIMQSKKIILTLILVVCALLVLTGAAANAETLSFDMPSMPEIPSVTVDLPNLEAEAAAAIAEQKAFLTGSELPNEAAVAQYVAEQKAALLSSALGIPQEAFAGADASAKMGGEFSASLDAAFVSAVQNALNAANKVSYDYNATLYKPETGNYPGVYVTELTPNSADAQNAQTIGFPSIADQNLDKPTTESPAIIQGAAVGYENKIGPVDYEKIKDRIAPYDEFMYKIIEEQVTDASGKTTVHKKMSGFDGTYIIARLDVSQFFSGPKDIWLHVKQEKNKALIPAATTELKDGEYEFTDGFGTRTGSYNASTLKDEDGEKLYYDIVLLSSGKLAAGADAGKTDAGNGDVPLQMYVDMTPDYDPTLKFDPQSTDPDHSTKVLAKFFNLEKSKELYPELDNKASNYLIKGDDLALETAVENSGGENKDTGTTYWSLAKSLEDPYYDLPEDSSPDDPGSGRTIKMISEVPVTEQLNLEGTDAEHLKKRTLDLNSFDIQIANNTTTDQSTYSDGFLIKNAWLTIADKSNTTGAELAIGNNSHFIIDQGGKLIIDETCQLEIEWDGATTAPGSTTPTTPDILNNGILDLRAGGEIVNNGIITIEGTEGKPAAPGSTAEQASQSEKGFGEMTIAEGATLTNNGSLVVYGKLYNLGTLVNNGKYSDTIDQNDPDKGTFSYHKGIQISWKDDVTQQNVEPGALYNGIDRDGNTAPNAQLINNGDIVLSPGTINNYKVLRNEDGSSIYVAAATEAIIPIEPPAGQAQTNPPAPTTKRIILDTPKGSSIVNYGTIINDGKIVPATVAVRDDSGLGEITTPGKNPELFALDNHGTVVNNGYIYGYPVNVSVNTNGSGSVYVVGEPFGIIESADGVWLYLYADGTFVILFPDGSKLEGTFRFADGMLILMMADGTEIVPSVDAQGDFVYDFTAPSGTAVRFMLSTDALALLQQQLEQGEASLKIGE